MAIGESSGRPYGGSLGQSYCHSLMSSGNYIDMRSLADLAILCNFLEHDSTPRDDSTLNFETPASIDFFDES
jgi:hypothetical protein